MVQPKHFAFDVDGTLIDTGNLTTRDLVAFLAEYGIHMTYEHYMETYFGHGGTHLMELLNKDYGTNLDWEEFKPRRVARLPAIFQKGVPLAPGAEAVLQYLLDNGHSFCLATNSTPDRNAELLPNLILKSEKLRAHLAANCFSADPEQGRAPKPAPDVYLDVAKHYGFTPNECLALEDGMPGLQSALAAGYQTLGYVGLAYKQAEEEQGLRTAGVAHLIRHWDEFIPWLHVQN